MRAEVRIASPCTADWNKMQGDDRVRHCAQCNLDVYNFAAMSDLDVEQLIANRQGRLCARIYRRADGTVLTQNCPVGFRAQVRKISRIAGAALSAAMSVTFAVAQIRLPNHQPTQVAQRTKAAISVHVSERSGAVIPKATILLSDSETGKEFHETTGTNGDVQLANLSAGRYQIAISAPGFKTAIYESVMLRANENKKIDVSLNVAEMEMGVVVDPSIQAVPTDLLDLPDKIR
ncbi:MAG TPA: carboxypeptidase-like regulatory domain-containing protein [Terriglobales bacterium]|nr:carboxypeptidase-like regulatory domain-containing protein [Terriglobales bacterium]